MLVITFTAGSIDCQQPLKWIIDLTIGYPQGQPLDMFSITFGERPPCETHFYYRVYPLSAVPADPDVMLQWLYDRYIEKEALLDAFYATGEFPALNPADCHGTVLSKKHYADMKLSSVLAANVFNIVTMYNAVRLVLYVFSLLAALC